MLLAQLAVTEASDDVVIDYAHGLYEGVTDRRADIAEAALFVELGTCIPSPGRARGSCSGTERHRLYERERGKPEGSPRLGAYVRRWHGWVRGGLPAANPLAPVTLILVARRGRLAWATGARALAALVYRSGAFAVAVSARPT